MDHSNRERDQRRLAQFKSRGRAAEAQQKRRERMLQAQKSRRQRQFDLTRGIILDESQSTASARKAQEGDDGDDGMDANANAVVGTEVAGIDEDVDDDEPRGSGKQASAILPGHQHKQKPRPRARFADQLMLGEALEEVPEDATSHWGAIICPKGQRCVMVAYQGRTRAYSRKGRFLFEFPSMLPGGSPYSQAGRGSCVLDVIFDHGEEVFYVLDILHWQGMNILDNPFEFRSFWVRTKWMELGDDILYGSDENYYPLLPLRTLPCESDAIASEQQEQQYQLDGILLYHKDGLYEPGESPLVLWVSRAQVVDVLGVSLG